MACLRKTSALLKTEPLGYLPLVFPEHQGRPLVLEEVEETTAGLLKKEMGEGEGTVAERAPGPVTFLLCPGKVPAAVTLCDLRFRSGQEEG